MQLVNKTETIKRLLESGKYSDEEIAKMVNSTKRYVQKVKCIYKVKGKEIDNSNDSLKMEELTKDDRKIIYNAFKEGKKPIDIIAEYGFRKEDVEEEYRYFLKHSSFDIYKFQERIVKDAEFFGGIKVKRFINVYKERLLTDEEMFELIDRLRSEDYNYGYNEGYNEAMIDIKDCKASPSNWIFIPCKVCKKPLYGVILDPNNPLGRDIVEYCKDKGWIHADCQRYPVNGVNTKIDW